MHVAIYSIMHSYFPHFQDFNLTPLLIGLHHFYEFMPSLPSRIVCSSILLSAAMYLGPLAMLDNMHSLLEC